MPGEKNNARNNVRCTQARKTTHGLDRQHQDVDKTCCGRVSRNDREDRDKWRNYVHGVANPRIEDGEGTEQNRMALRHLGFLRIQNFNRL